MLNIEYLGIFFENVYFFVEVSFWDAPFIDARLLLQNTLQMKQVFSFLFLIGCGSFLLAQEITVTGTVYDKALNEPLPGVNVIVKNTTQGTTTDFDGNFSLPGVSVGDILVFSYISFQSKEVGVVSQEPMAVFLEEDVSALDEVVVIGYGTQTKKEITGAVTVVGSETIEELNPTRIEQALQGQVSGVNITSESGSPGSGSNIRIRVFPQMATIGL